MEKNIAAQGSRRDHPGGGIKGGERMDFELLDSLIQSKKEQFWEMSDQIWGFAEMRFKEVMPVIGCNITGRRNMESMW